MFIYPQTKKTVNILVFHKEKGQLQSAGADTFGKLPPKRLVFVAFHRVGSTSDKDTCHI